MKNEHVADTMTNLIGLIRCGRETLKHHTRKREQFLSAAEEMAWKLREECDVIYCPPDRIGHIVRRRPVDEQLLHDLKSLYGLPPHDGPENICRNDAYFANSLMRKYRGTLPELCRRVGLEV